MTARQIAATRFSLAFVLRMTVALLIWAALLTPMLASPDAYGPSEMVHVPPSSNGWVVAP